MIASKAKYTGNSESLRAHFARATLTIEEWKAEQQLSVHGGAGRRASVGSATHASRSTDTTSVRQFLSMNMVSLTGSTPVGAAETL
jgi:hypothetical protein